VTDEPSEFSVRGEIFINKSDFAEYNRGFEDKYANPRNLAAGSLRNQKSSIVAHVPLNMLSYEGDFPAPSPESGHLDSHIKILSRMASLGFPVNPNLAFFSNDPDARSLVNDLFPAMTTGDIQDISEYVAERMSARDDLDYEIDGLVVKVNEIAVRQRLGATAHHPRWAMAFKFDSPVAHTVLKDIQVQIGRNGRVTPVAILEAVRVGGSVVSRATLHNQEYIDILELGIGDRVSISKRGDIIPAVDKVLEKARESPTVFKLPSDCPFCGKKIEKTGAHHFCMNRACPERIKRAIVYFAGRNQMDIDTLGEKTIDVLLDNGLIKGIADLYDFDYSRLQGLEGFKERKIENLRRSIEKSKEQPFHKVLAALGLEGLAGNTVRELIRRGFDSVEKLITAASNGDSASFADLDGFGDVTSRLIIDQFTDPENLRLIRRLRKAGLNFSEKGGPDDLPEIFQNQIWVITGTLLSFSPRQKAVEEIEVRGGRVSAGVTSKTTHLLAGASPGSKLAKARELGVQIVNEEEFRKMLE
jgi:DNA ligase (NAD+)